MQKTHHIHVLTATQSSRDKERLVLADHKLFQCEGVNNVMKKLDYSSMTH